MGSCALIIAAPPASASPSSPPVERSLGKRKKRAVREEPLEFTPHLVDDDVRFRGSTSIVSIHQTRAMRYFEVEGGRYMATKGYFDGSVDGEYGTYVCAGGCPKNTLPPERIFTGRTSPGSSVASEALD